MHGNEEAVVGGFVAKYWTLVTMFTLARIES